MYLDGQVRGPSGDEKPVRFLVDSGTTYSLLPEPVWRSIGLRPRRRMSFTLADGTPVVREVSECYVVLPRGEGHTPVILGQADDAALLGVVTLEILDLVFNPFNRTVQPMKGMLA